MLIDDIKSHALNGWEILNGGTSDVKSSIEGSYYGFLIVSAPTSMKMEGLNGSKFKINGEAILPTTELINYFPELIYQPCIFSKMTITGGVVIVYKTN